MWIGVLTYTYTWKKVKCLTQGQNKFLFTCGGVYFTKLYP